MALKYEFKQSYESQMCIIAQNHLPRPVTTMAPRSAT